MTRVLLVDDDTQSLRALRITLAARGYTVLTAADGRTALRVAADHEPDVIVLDLGLPDRDGADVIAHLRSSTSVPIIVLSARTDSADKVHALDRGADDYVTKPFGMAELLARMRAAVRRAGSGGDAADSPIRARRPSPSTSPPRSSIGTASEVRLTPTEWGILELLARNHGRLVAAGSCCSDSLGPRRPQGDQLPSGIPGAVAPQARAGPRPPPPPHHRGRYGLPVPRLARRRDTPPPRADGAVCAQREDLRAS